MKQIITILLLFKSSVSFSQERYNESVLSVIDFGEDFSSNIRNWPQGENDSLGLKIVNGVYYTMAAKNNIILPKKLTTSLSNKKNLWRLSAEVTYADGKNYFGLLFGSFDSKTTYAFMINGGGGFVILQTEGDKNTVLTQGKSSKINIGKGAVNILSIETDNDYLFNFPNTRFLVNGSDVHSLTKAEQDNYDAAAAEKKKNTKEENKSVQFTLEDINGMQRDLTLQRIDPENFGNGKIGIITTRGAAANFDNIKLEIKPNKGRIIMYSNKWEYDPYFTKYLAKEIAAEEQLQRTERENKKTKEAAEELTKAKAAIFRLSEKLLHPYGNTLAAAKPDEKAVAWLRKFISSLEGGVGGSLLTYPEKNLAVDDDSSVSYQVKHYLPGIDASVKVLVNKKTRKGSCIIPLAKGLTTDAATTLCSNYLANVAAAFDVIDNEYYAPTNIPASNDIPRPLFINGGKSFISNSYTAARIEPKKDKQGNWTVLLYLFSN